VTASAGVPVRPEERNELVAAHFADGMRRQNGEQRQGMALFAILAAHSVGEVSRDQLIALLWPDRDSSRSRHLLSEALYVLRNAVGRDSIRSVGSGLAITPGLLTTDVHLFREALEAGDHRAAVEVYGGKFLDGFHLQESGEFHHWVDGRRLHFASRYAEAMSVLAAEATAAGNQLEAAHWYRMRLAQDPFSGSSTRSLMAALARAGDRAEAIRVGREYERRLRDDLGLPPSEEVISLRARLEGPHWIAPRPAPSKWRPDWSEDRRAVARVDPMRADLGEDLPPAHEEAPPEYGDTPPEMEWPSVKGRSSLTVLGGPLALVVVAVAAILAGSQLLSRVPWDLAWNLGGAPPYRVAVLPLSSCCSDALSADAHRLTLVLADTLAVVPGQRLLEPGRVLAAWHKAAAISGTGDPPPDRFASGIGAGRYVTGSIIEVGRSEVRVEVSLREVGRQPAIYVTRGSAAPKGVGAVLEGMAGNLAEYLRGEAAGRGLSVSTGPVPRVRDLSDTQPRPSSRP